MKKLQNILVAMMAVLLPVLFSGGAYAVDSCPVGYTGPNSSNLCISETTYNCTVINSTTVEVNNSNTQIAVTGDAQNGSSGSATNSNGVTFNATVDNSGELCTVVASVPAIKPASTPITPAAVVTPPVKTTATKLPYTSGASDIILAAELAGVLALAGIGLALAKKLYSNKKI